ncbi:DUF5674 family protein [Microcoleus sp. N3A4]
MLAILSSYIKLAVDIEREILAGGGEFHADFVSFYYFFANLDR